MFLSQFVSSGQQPCSEVKTHKPVTPSEGVEGAKACKGEWYVRCKQWSECKTCAACNVRRVEGAQYERSSVALFEEFAVPLVPGAPVLEIRIMSDRTKLEHASKQETFHGSIWAHVFELFHARSSKRVLPSPENSAREPAS